MKKASFSNSFSRQIKKMPEATKRKFEKQLGFLLKDINYPSLRAKKFDEVNDIWQARVDDNFRFYFKIYKDIYQILTINKHSE